MVSTQLFAAESLIFTSRSKIIKKEIRHGLAVVHRMVQSHYGTMRVKSEVGKDTRFHVYFPAWKEKLESVMRNNGATPKGNKKVMFVDDEPSLARLGRRILEKLGYAAEEFTSPIAALKSFSADPSRYDLVITDISMPEMGGDAFAQSILGLRSDVPIILCSGFSEKMNETRARELGIRNYVEKPFNKGALALAIHKALDDHGTS